ncbi:MAG: VanZ family protein [Rhizobiales bacterium]|nr:VanZ family protein [Rhizobacter sp.]
MARHRSSAAPLAWLYAALIAYASLYPFVPWKLPGVSPLAFLTLPWPRYWTGFDLGANLLGYVPLGALVFVAIVRSGGRAKPALLGAVAAGAAWSLAMEFTQNFLPQRVASNLDLALNSLGVLIGAALGLWVHLRGGVERWQVARDRWFIGRSAGGIALLLLWPVGMLFPLPVPFAQGQVLTTAQEAIATWVADTPLAPWVEGWADAGLAQSALSPGGEFALIALGLLAPCLVAFSVARGGWRRLALVFGAAALGVLATTLSTALNFGPQHLTAWSTPQALTALAFAMSLAALLSLLPRRASAGLGLVALTALVIGVAQAPSDPFFAQSLQAWEQGRFIRFYGLARWVGWLWPYAAIAYLLARLGARDEAPSTLPPKMPP